LAVDEADQVFYFFRVCFFLFFLFFYFFCIVCMEDDDCDFEDLIGLFVSGIGFSFSIFLFFIRLCLIFSC
jgi:hypothetical protein